MPRSERSGKVQTVLGLIRPESLGVTLTHEHLLIDLKLIHQPPEEASERAWVDAPVTMDRLGGMAKRTHHSIPNTRLLDVETAIEEILRYKHAGGDSLVDATAIGAGRDPLALARISRATGLNIVMGGSHYTPLSYPPDMDSRSEDSIFERIVRDVTVGVGDTGIRSGIIGEVGNFWPMTDVQRRVLRASARAQVATGAAILIHPGIHPKSPMAILDVLVKAGARPERIIIGHLDLFHDPKVFKDISQAGCYLEWDIFGYEDTSWEGLGVHELVLFASDVERMDRLERLIADGYGDRLVVAQDVCLHIHQRMYGGKGYAHILENIVPRMRKRGFTDAQVHAILVDNPKRILTFE